MIIASGAGHGGPDPGAVAYGNYEATIARQLCGSFNNLLRSGGHVVHDITVDKGYPNNVNEPAAAANSVNAECAIQHHLNAGGGNGPEVLYSPGDMFGYDLAVRISAAIAEYYGLPNRGAKARDNLGFINQTNMTAIMIEWGFMDSPGNTDVSRILGDVSGGTYAAASVFGGLTPVSNTPKQPDSTARNNNQLWYRAHSARVGWLPAVHDGMIAGTLGYSSAIEAIKISPPEGVVLDVSLHIAEIGWKTWHGIMAGGERESTDPIMGTTGEAKALEAIMITPTTIPQGQKLIFRTHLANTGWTPWVAGGYSSGSVGLQKNIEAIEIALV